MTWMFLVGNITAYVRARRELGQQRPPVVSLPAETTSGEAALRLLSPFEHSVRRRLREGEGEAEQAVAADLARVHGVALASAEYFVETVSGAASPEGGRQGRGGSVYSNT
jgi:hypothetical protein